MPLTGENAENAENAEKPYPDSKRFSTVDNTRFGVNIIVYALTR